MTRVATPESEEELLEIAEHATAAQLEALIRRFRGVLEVELGDADDAFRRRYVNCRHDDDGSLLIEARLPAEEGAVMLAALAAARSALRTAEDVSAETSSGRHAVSNADALVLMADSLVGSSPVARNGGERYQVVVHVDAATLSGESEHGIGELEHGSALHPETARRLACDAAVVRILERDGARFRSAAGRVACRRRSGGLCRAVTGAAASPAAASAGSWMPITSSIDHRLLHEGGYRIRRSSGGELVFHHPSGRKLRARPILGSGDPRDPGRRNAAGGLRITEHTCVPNWDGSRVNHGWEVERLSRKDPRFAPD